MNETGRNGRGEEELDRFIANSATAIIILTIAFVIYALNN